MQKRAETTRRSILEAAAHLFDQRGFFGTSISDISALSGRTSGAIYFHYTSKENLAACVVREHFATWPPLIARHAPAALPALEGTVRLSFAVARAFRDDVVARAGARLSAERKSIEADLPAPFVGWIGTVTGLLERAGEEGDLAPGAVPARAAHGVVSAFFGLHTVADALDGRQTIEARLHDLWLLLLPALQADPDSQGLLERARRGFTEELPRPAAPPRTGAGAVSR
ncbi:ScbR family autoregulator-binding transcription factor [Streptomyces sp. TRM 70351]|uniref:ScbR family autoregulator-binding transcription factor n=1 Tax=Streptomyces sp. TRM 70351 TaxID=3116552 RepID=UPI002E7B8EC2|nr:ScbR family autoregulator-binding transcription factor [Streptomyces sp. TRM 70351]MEE1930217.1 ScbR family autoregulator-binding transcription factor [Streptomyces sp. TRM 70351]